MGVPIDRGLTHGSNSGSCGEAIFVEMGVPIDRGLTHRKGGCKAFLNNVEMGVPIDRGLTHRHHRCLRHLTCHGRNGCPDR